MPATKPSSYSWPAMLAGVLSSSLRSVSDHSRHFLSLSILFLLPLSSLLISSPSLPPLLLPPLQSPRPQSLLESPLPPPRSPLLPAASLAALLPLSSAAAASLTRSLHNRFYGRPLHLLPALKALPLPTLRLLATALSALLVFSALLALVLSLSLLLLLLLSSLGAASASVPPTNSPPSSPPSRPRAWDSNGVSPARSPSWSPAGGSLRCGGAAS